MESVLGVGEDEAKSKACSPEIDSGEETLKDNDCQENGIRVSENGEKKCDDDAKAKENVADTENLNESGVIEDCVMNGVSSLLKLKQDVSDKEIDEDEEEEEEEEEDGEDDEEEEEEEEEHGYCVGDFVWGKIKNHPWWPGQIYDPSDASDLALKIKQKGKLLVAYFGDGTFAWCGASQLKPFAESFKECSTMSYSRSFLRAVEEAVEEMGRHIERLLICDCAEEKHKFLHSSEANNAGIKEGVFVRDVRREMISSLLVGKTGEILKDVKCFAETGSFSSLLELEILKRKVSAFYRSKRGYGLTEYHEPQSVPGLEDKNNDDEEQNVDDGLEWRAKRSSIEEAAAVDPSLQGSLETCSGFSDHRLHHRRKEKSIAEILENESAAKVRFETEPLNGDVQSGWKKLKRRDEGTDEPENVTTTTSRRRKKSEVSTAEDAGRKLVEENSKGKTFLMKRKKRDVDDGSGDREDTEENEVSDLEVDIDSTPLASLRKRVKFDASSADNGETTVQTSKRERKKSKYLSPEYLSDFSWKGRKKSKIESESSKVSSQSQVIEHMTDASDSLVAVEEDKLDKPCEPSSDSGLGCQELSEELRNAVDFLRLGATPEEMGDLIRVAALGTQYPKDSCSIDMVREFMTIYRSFTYHDGANHKFLGSYDSSDKEKEQLNETGEPKTKGKDTKDKKRKVKQQAEEIEENGKEDNETDKHGTTKKERKHKNSESKKADEEEETRNETVKPKKKKRDGKSEKVEETEKEFSGAELFATFGPGSILPKKEDLIEIYEKFGALDKERTDMICSNFCGRVAFLDVADGEKAFESSQDKCPFASKSTVKFRLKYPNGKTEEKKTGAEVAETTIEIEYAKKKVEEMRTLLDKCEGGMSEEVNVKLEGELVNLLGKVREMRFS